jgi:hypothetical protein
MSWRTKASFAIAQQAWYRLLNDYALKINGTAQLLDCGQIVCLYLALLHVVAFLHIRAAS